MKIIVDADACPVKSIIYRVAKRYGIRVILVHSINHCSSQEEEMERVIVDHRDQEADMAIVNLTQRGDLVITADIGLGALVLGKGAYAMNPWGRFYTHETIDFVLEERYYRQKVLQQGGRLKGPSKRSKRDDELFQSALEDFIQRIAK